MANPNTRCDNCYWCAVPEGGMPNGSYGHCHVEKPCFRETGAQHDASNITKKDYGLPMVEADGWCSAWRHINNPPPA